MNRLRLFFAVLVVSVFMANSVQGYDLNLNCRSAILIEETTGKVLFEKASGLKLYPASMTKLLTALVALEHLSPDEYVVTGYEINEIPLDSSRAYHLNGETLLVKNLIRGLIIPSGNETACVIAKAVAMRIKNVDTINYADAEMFFCELMNEKAKELGAVNTNFINPHGYHNDNHYTTAADMALICREAMKNSLIRDTVAETEFVGNGAGENPDPSWKTQEYNWPTHNQLIMRNSEDYYSPATGMKTGFTNEAGYCLAASAEKDGRRLIAVIMNAEEESFRYSDAKTLFKFGFETFNDETVQRAGTVIDKAVIANPILGESDELDLLAEDEVVHYMSKEELGRVIRETEILPEMLTTYEDTEGLITPITQSQPIANVKYTLDGEVIYEGRLLAADGVEERTFKTDLNYYLDSTSDFMFSQKAVPYWLGAIAAVFLVVRLTVVMKRRQKRRRNPYKFSKPRRF